MTKRERIQHAFHNEPVDRIPLGFWYHFSPDEDNGQETVDAHLGLYHDTDMDMVKVMCDGYFNYPNPSIDQVECPNDWFEITPMGEEHPFIRRQVERAKGVVKGVQGECCVFYNVFCPMSLLRFRIGEEKLTEHLKTNPAAVCHAFSVIAQDIKSLVRLLIQEAGCDGIYYCVQNAEEFRFSAEEYRRLISPSELDILKYANTLSDLNILHCCGWAGDKNRLEVWQDYPSAAVNWAVYVEKMDLTEGRDFFGGRCVLGGFDNRKEGILYSGSREQIEEETMNIVRKAGSIGLVVGADCTLPSDIDPVRFSWVGDILKKLEINN